MKKKPKNWGCLAAACVAVILACAILYTAISNAIDDALAMTMKKRCRYIWISIISANTERELHGLPPLWPADLAQAGITFTSSEAYFTYLMSDGTNTHVIAENSEHRIVGDLSPEWLTYPGMKAAKAGQPMLPENNPWHVVNIGDNSPAEMPFLITRNAKASAIVYSPPEEYWWSYQFRKPDANDVFIPLNKKIKPFGGKRAVWVTKGGSTIHAHQALLARWLVIPMAKPEGKPELTVLPSQGGFQ